MLIDAGPTYYDGSRMDYLSSRDAARLTQKAEDRLGCPECKARYRQRLGKLNRKIKKLKMALEKSNKRVKLTPEAGASYPYRWTIKNLMEKEYVLYE